MALSNTSMHASQLTQQAELFHTRNTAPRLPIYIWCSHFDTAGPQDTLGLVLIPGARAQFRDHPVVFSKARHAGHTVALERSIAVQKDAHWAYQILYIVRAIHIKHVPAVTPNTALIHDPPCALLRS
jgi:hypothetical protein